MKRWALALGFFLSMPLSVFAANKHLHPQASSENNPSVKQKLQSPGYCEIEIVNNSYDDVRVYGIFDDGASLEPFNVYGFGTPHYISMYYYGYCHAGMTLYVDTFSGYRIYAGYTPTQSTIRVVPYRQQLKAEVIAK